MNFDTSYPQAALEVIYMTEIDENPMNWGKKN